MASNAGNWQWVARTFDNTRLNPVMNPLRQAQRFDKAGEYVRRYVPGLASLTPAAVQSPWRLNEATAGNSATGPDRRAQLRSPRYIPSFLPNGPWFLRQGNGPPGAVMPPDGPSR